MPFTSYGSVAEVARAYQIHVERSPFVTPVAAPLSEYFRTELELTLSEVPFDNSESAACETLIYPLLREVWKPCRDALTLWSHQPIAYDADLCGVPDYMVARRSPLGASILDLPYLLVVEAKRDDFTTGWGQCLAAMLAARELNEQPGRPVYGITTNGRSWEFARLQENIFTQDQRPFSLQDINTLSGALHSVVIACRDEVRELVVGV